MKPAAPGDTQPLSPAQPPLRLLRWQARTQVFHEELGGAALLTMVRIPAGSFQMGSAEQEPGRHANEGPLHTVTLAEFLIGQTPITQAQWRAVACWEPQKGERWGRELNPKPAKFQGEEARLLAGEMNTDERPVERVSWLDAMEFCSRLSQRTKRNYTLPSEAQWEYACRAGTSTAYCFGPVIYSDLANFNGTDESRFNALNTPDPQPIFREQTTPVGMFPANALGLYDMHGNVWEWCLDHVHSSYEGAPCDGSGWEDPQAPKEQQRITRGGSWSRPPRFCRSAFRSPFRSPSKAKVTDDPYDDAGFRVVCLTRGSSLDFLANCGLGEASTNDVFAEPSQALEHILESTSFSSGSVKEIAVAGEDIDVYISFAYGDNVPVLANEQGWVSSFHLALKVILGHRLGRDANVWLGQEVIGVHPMAIDTFFDRIVKATALVAVITPLYLRSEWSMHELEKFKPTIFEGCHSNLFPVYRFPIDNRHEIPAHARDVLGYNFYTNEGGVPIELVADSREYRTVVARLASDIARRIRIGDK